MGPVRTQQTPPFTIPGTLTRWLRTEEEWEPVIEVLQDELEEERVRRFEAEDKADKLAAELEVLRGTAGRQPPSLELS